MSNMENKRVTTGKALAVAMLCCASGPGFTGLAHAQADQPADRLASRVPGMHTATPALEHYTQELLLRDVWKRPDLSPRDRGTSATLLVVAAVLATMAARASRTAAIPAR